MEVVRCNVAGVKRDAMEVAGGLCRDIFSMGASIRQNVDQSLFTASSQLEEMFDCEAKALQEGVHDHLCNAAGGLQESFVDAFDFEDRKLSLIVDHSEGDESARPGSLPAHSASHGLPQSRTRAVSDSEVAAMGDKTRSSTPAAPVATSPRDYPRQR